MNTKITSMDGHGKAILSALEDFECGNCGSGWAGYQNGLGEEVGTALDAAIAGLAKACEGGAS